MSLSPSMRTKPGASHLAFLLPDGFKSIAQVMPHFIASSTIAGDGVEIPPTVAYPHTRRSKQHILFFTGDTRAIPLANCQRQTPATIGACNHCWAGGVHVSARGKFNRNLNRERSRDVPRVAVDDLESARTNMTIYLNLLAFLGPRERREFQDEITESFKNAPRDVKEVRLQIVLFGGN